MASRYSIIQYVPNSIADERINIGVLVFDRQNVKVHFLSNWDRVRRFGRQADIKTLKDFANRMQESAQKGLLFPGDEPSDRPKHERLLEVALDWINCIQFTQPRGSLEQIDSLLDDVIQTYLLEPQPKLKCSDDFPEPEQELGKVKVWLKQAKPEDIAQIVQFGADLLAQVIKPKPVQLPVIAIKAQQAEISFEDLIEDSVLGPTERQLAILYLEGKVEKVHVAIIAELEASLSNLSAIAIL